MIKYFQWGNVQDVQKFIISDTEKAESSIILDAIGTYLSPKINKRFERAVFNMAKWKLLNSLNTLIKNCQYGSPDEDLLLDKKYIQLWISN